MPSPFTPLIKRAKSGETEAFAELVQLTKNRLYRFLLLLARDPALASDLCQDTYLYALEHLHALTEPAAFPRWLFLIGKNRFLDHKRSAGSKPYEDIDDAKGLSVASGDKELALQTKQALAQLPAPDRIVLLLVDLEGYTYEEAAETIGVSESALRSRLHRARQAFHTIFFKV